MVLNPPSLDHRPSQEPHRGAILLHGRNRPPGDMRDIAASLGMLDWRCVFPAVEGSSWYPHPFTGPIEENEPALGASVERIRLDLERIEGEGLAAEKVLVGGFSQGACVVAEYLARGGPRPMAILLLSGALPGPDDLVRPPRADLAGVPAFVTGSHADPYMPAARVAATAEWLRAGGAEVHLTLFEDRLHTIDESEIADAASFIAGLERQDEET